MVAVESPAEPLPATRALRVGRPPSAAAPVPPAAEPVLPTVCQADIARDDLTGLGLEQYVLGQRIGHGGMGKVFRARHRHLDRILAIKFVAADLNGDSEARQRFEHETRALGQLQHPQIVNAVDAGSCRGLMYLVMEYVDGEDLSQLVARRGPLPQAEACALVRQAAQGLAYLHSRGFVHRDIKPSNLIVDRAGCVKILDLGLVRSVHSDQQLTDDGQTLGTWDFLAPEQGHDSRDVDCRSDLYSLGGTLLYLLSGKVPFGGARYATPAAKLKGHLFDAPAALDEPGTGISPELIAVLSRLLAKSPSDRFGSADEAEAALAPFAAQFREPAAAGSLPPGGREHALSRWMRRRAPFVIVGGLALGGLMLSRGAGQPVSARPAVPVGQTPATPVGQTPATPVGQTPADAGSPDVSGGADDTNETAEPAPGPAAVREFTPRTPGRTTITPQRTNDASPVRLSLPDAVSRHGSSVVAPN